MSCLVQSCQVGSKSKNTGPGCMVKAGGTGHAEILLQHQKVRKDSRILGTSSSSTRPTITSTAMLEDLFWVGRCQGTRSIQWTLFIPFPQRNRWIHCALGPKLNPNHGIDTSSRNMTCWRVHRKWSNKGPERSQSLSSFFLAAGSSKDQPLEPSPQACFPKSYPCPVQTYLNNLNVASSGPTHVFAYMIKKNTSCKTSMIYCFFIMVVLSLTHVAWVCSF